MDLDVEPKFRFSPEGKHKIDQLVVVSITFNHPIITVGAQFSALVIQSEFWESFY